MNRCDLSAELLRELLDYDPATGVFRRKAATSRGGPAGSVTGAVNKRHGYVYVFAAGHNWGAHRLAWLHVHGAWPTHEVDHINGVRTDNRMVNLREATPGENRQNRQRPQSNCKVGLLGVIKKGRGFQANIVTGRKQKYLGTFDSAEEAHAAYLKAKRELHSHNTL